MSSLVSRWNWIAFFVNAVIKQEKGRCEMMTWTAYEQGGTLGKKGREGGVIRVDEEYTGAARIMLEKNCLRAPYAITSSVYGFMLHTRFVADDETAQYALDEMKAALAAIVQLIPDEDDPNEGSQIDAVDNAVESFMRRYP